MTAVAAAPARTETGALRALLPQLAPFLGILVVAMILPFVSNDYWALIGTRAAIYWVLVSGLNLVVGFAVGPVVDDQIDPALGHFLNVALAPLGGDRDEDLIANPFYHVVLRFRTKGTTGASPFSPNECCGAARVMHPRI